MKKKIAERKKKKIGPIISVIVIAIIIIGGIYYYNQQKASEVDVQWQNVSGPFAINKFQYKLGENVFMIVSNLKPNEAGKIVVVDPKGDIYSTIPFNGTLKTSFHQFFKPDTINVGVKICTPAELVGRWGIIFQGVHYHPLSFNVTNDWIQGSQSEIKAIPPDLCK
ncbi:MAG TPA: hypothetical protein VGR54_05710 [Nitrosopumilaceae archaeon]|nr:hypothetical protein [Nitrosopumilaceae archaeon]